MRKGDYESNEALTDTQKQQLAYYDIRAPFNGVVGDIPVHLGDYVSPTTLLTTVDENADLEAYIYIPTERAAQIRQGLPVDILDGTGKTLVKSRISFLSPQVDNGLQSILAKAEVPRTAEILRNQQLVTARVTWSTAPARSGGSCSRREPGWRTVVRLCCRTQGRWIHRSPGAGKAWGNCRQHISRLGRSETGR